MDIIYGDYKAKITTIDKDGKHIGEFTTWREDIINNIIEATHMSTLMSRGCRMTVLIEPNKERKTT